MLKRTPLDYEQQAEGVGANVLAPGVVGKPSPGQAAVGASRIYQFSIGPAILGLFEGGFKVSSGTVK